LQNRRRGGRERGKAQTGAMRNMAAEMAISEPAPTMPFERRNDGSAATDFLQAVRRLTADLYRPNRAVYWIDLCASAAVGYAALGVATYDSNLAVCLAAGLVAVFALYRAVMFIHELMHLRRGAVPGLWTAWNVLIGVPLLLPSFMYENVHRLHHAKSHYGTKDDPEYLPLVRAGLPTILALLFGALFAPLLLLLRFAIVVPLAALVPAVRRLMIERMSSLTINPQFRRAVPERPVVWWIALEAAGAFYVWTALTLLAMGTLPAASFLTAIAIGAGIAFVNQARTVVAHRWESDGHTTDAIGQLLDTVNVPPPALLPALWAPLGLRYHGLHHLLPAMPYHRLGEAHRRLVAGLAAASPYHRSLNRSGREAFRRMVGRTFTLHAPQS
jgi:fatty acid desaturase